MIPLNLDAAKRAMDENKIRLKDLIFLEGVSKQDSLSEKQYEYITSLALKILPHKLFVADIKTSRAPVDPYFNQRYHTDEY